MITKRIKLGLMLALSCLILLSFAACGGQTDEIQQEFVEVTRGDILLTVTGDGNLSLPQHRKLTFDTSGEITKIYVEEGDRVTKGQVLAGLDTTSLKRGIRTAEIAVITAELAASSAEIDLKSAADTIIAATVDLEQATDSYRKITYPYTYSTLVLDVPEALADIRDAERQVKEAMEVLKVGLSSDQYWEAWHQLKKAQDNLIDARERLARGTGEDVFEQQLLEVKDFWTLRAAELAMKKAESALAQAIDARDKENIALAKAKNEVANSRNNLDKARDELDKAVIVAPFDGVIAQVNAKTGDSLSPVTYATETIIEIIDPSRMEFKAEVDEIDIPLVNPGQEVIITLDALPDSELEGKVLFISPLSREEAGVILYEVKIGLDVPEGSALRTGMSATADIILDKRIGVLQVPSRAVTEDSSGKSVVRVVVDEEIQEREVVTGISDSYQTEIVAGLSEGEVVVVERKVKPETAGGIFGG